MVPVTLPETITHPLNCALVLGGYINGYSIIRELYDCEVENIWLLDYGNSLASRSNKITGYTRIEKNAESLKAAIDQLHKKFDYIVCYPTDDMQLEFLNQIRPQILDFCFLPFNENNLTTSLDKDVQYEFCETLKIPYPKTVSLKTIEDTEKINDLQFPILIKPNKREDLTSNVFRSLYLKDSNELAKCHKEIDNHLKNGTSFLASEYIPGDDTNIFAYTGYRSRKGVILNEWIGKKLTQYPDLFGVYSSASNEAPDIVRTQGRALLESMNLMGLAEPEFKFDIRDGKYKLMEVNLRSMMWHRTGRLSGVNLQHTQWLDATKQPPQPDKQVFNPVIHFIYMKHEIINLLSRSNYLKHFIHNVFGGENRGFAVFDRHDLKPFFFDLSTLPRGIASKWVRILRMRFGRL